MKILDFIKSNKSLVGAIVLAILIYFFGGTVNDYFFPPVVDEPILIDSLSNPVDTLKF